MDTLPHLLQTSWHTIVWPMIRLIFSISAGVLVANFIEALNWTRGIALFARPLARIGNMSDTAGASFSIALFSGLAANTMLSEAHENGTMSRRELVIANLFNSLPTYFVHLPSVFFITVPIIHGAAFVYTALTVAAAFLRTLGIVLVGRVVLPRVDQAVEVAAESMKAPAQITWQSAWEKTLKRFKRRIRKIILITVPIYLVVYAMHHYGIFKEIESAMASFMTVVPWLSPKSVGIIALGFTAEITASVTAAGVILQEGSLPVRDVIVALMIGNILSSPIRAIRHQFPYYAGIFKPRLAGELILYNQLFRILSLIAVTVIYYSFVR